MRVSFGLVNDGETWGDIPKSFTNLAPLFRWRAASPAGIRRGDELLQRYG